MRLAPSFHCNKILAVSPVHVIIQEAVCREKWQTHLHPVGRVPEWWRSLIQQLVLITLTDTLWESYRHVTHQFDTGAGTDTCVWGALLVKNQSRVWELRVLATGPPEKTPALHK